MFEKLFACKISSCVIAFLVVHKNEKYPPLFRRGNAKTHAYLTYVRCQSYDYSGRQSICWQLASWPVNAMVSLRVTATRDSVCPRFLSSISPFLPFSFSRYVYVAISGSSIELSLISELSKEKQTVSASFEFYAQWWHLHAHATLTRKEKRGRKRERKSSPIKILARI